MKKLFLLLALFCNLAFGATANLTQDSTTLFPNPGRGWYFTCSGGLFSASCATDIAAAANGTYATSITTEQIRLVLAESTLPSSGSISGANLTQLNTNLAAARTNGVKMILRFAYCYSGDCSASQSMSQFTLHAGQLKPYLAANQDVIHVVQAGFLGTWGEWADFVGTNLDSKANKRALKDLVLDMTPPAVFAAFTQVYPMQEDWFSPGGGNLGNPLSQSEGFKGSKKARSGFHGDCQMAGPTDSFTFPGPGAINDFTWKATQLQQRNYVAALTEYAPYGGETCSNANPNLRIHCTDIADGAGLSGGALNEAPRYHWNYLHRGYALPFYDQWKADSPECYTTITNRLGHRFHIVQVVAPTSIAKGATGTITAYLRNTGYSRMFDDRVFRIVAIHTNGVDKFVGYATAKMNQCPSQQTTVNCKMNVRITVPAGQLSGTYNLHGWAPSDTPALEATRRFSYRFANSNSGGQTWDDTNARMALGISLTVP